jgi:hypothetical protein
MSEVRPAVDQAGEPEPECWCCGQHQPADRMVHLGHHPEVTICIRCAYSIKTWAWEMEDRDRHGLPARARNRFRDLRGAVMQGGWQHSRLIGRPLRWLGRRLP